MGNGNAQPHIARGEPTTNPFQRSGEGAGVVSYAHITITISASSHIDLYVYHQTTSHISATQFIYIFAALIAIPFHVSTTVSIMVSIMVSTVQGTKPAHTAMATSVRGRSSAALVVFCRDDAAGRQPTSHAASRVAADVVCDLLVASRRTLMDDR